MNEWPYVRTYIRRSFFSHKYCTPASSHLWCLPPTAYTSGGWIPQNATMAHTMDLPTNPQPIRRITLAKHPHPAPPTNPRKSKRIIFTCILGLESAWRQIGRAQRQPARPYLAAAERGQPGVASGAQQGRGRRHHRGLPPPPGRLVGACRIQHLLLTVCICATVVVCRSSAVPRLTAEQHSCSESVF